MHLSWVAFCYINFLWKYKLTLSPLYNFHINLLNYKYMHSYTSYIFTIISTYTHTHTHTPHSYIIYYFYNLLIYIQINIKLYSVCYTYT